MIVDDDIDMCCLIRWYDGHFNRDTHGIVGRFCAIFIRRKHAGENHRNESVATILIHKILHNSIATTTRLLSTIRHPIQQRHVLISAVAVTRRQLLISVTEYFYDLERGLWFVMDYGVGDDNNKKAKQRVHPPIAFIVCRWQNGFHANEFKPVCCCSHISFRNQSQRANSHAHVHVSCIDISMYKCTCVCASFNIKKSKWRVNKNSEKHLETNIYVCIRVQMCVYNNTVDCTSS